MSKPSAHFLKIQTLLAGIPDDPSEPVDRQRLSLAIEAHRASANDDFDGPLPPRSNVLPKTATKDEHDIHWHFNWAEGEMEPAPFSSLYDQALTKVRVQVSPQLKTQEPGDRERAAARRSSRILKIMKRIEPRHVSVLARWSAPPSRIPEPIWSCFGRLSAVTGVTPGYREIGGGAALVENCARVTAKAKRVKGATDFLRELARTKIAVIRGQAERLQEEAFAAYAKARVEVDADEVAQAARKRNHRTPALAQLAALFPEAANDGGAALAQLMGKASR